MIIGAFTLNACICKDKQTTSECLADKLNLVEMFRCCLDSVYSFVAIEIPPYHITDGGS